MVCTTKSTSGNLSSALIPHLGMIESKAIVFPPPCRVTFATAAFRTFFTLPVASFFSNVVDVVVCNLCSHSFAQLFLSTRYFVAPVCLSY